MLATGKGDERSAHRSLWRAAAVCCADDDQAATAVVGALRSALERRRRGDWARGDVWRALTSELRAAAHGRAPASRGGLRDAVAALPSDQRLAIALIDVAGLGTARAAAAAGVECARLARSRRAGLAALAHLRQAAAVGA